VKKQKVIVYNYDPYITVYKENFKNKYQSRKDFHNVKLPNGTMVILENNNNEILFLDEYRRGILRKSLGFPGGNIEPGEKPLNAIKRELLEETGYSAKKWKLLFKYTRHGTYNCGEDYVYTAKITSNTIKKSENLKKKWLNKKKIISLLYNNKFKTVGIIATISFYLLKEK
tara:strand:- start:781 stop:1293 length:513 start_codon:yes stop_codon:yes gene_type:complete